MTGRALSFGAVAAAYERFRPGYPGRLVDEVLAFARGPIRTALEIGAGTGKATRAFAAAGIAVTATDPDPAMLVELRRQLPAVTVMQAGFEELPLTRTYDLVFAAAALHWTEPAHRWSRVHALLNPNGVFASVGGPLQLADPAVDEAVRAARGDLLPDDGVPPPDATPPDSCLRWPGTELIRSAQFTDVGQVTIGRRVVMSDHEYLGHLSTVSSYLQLPPAVRDDLFGRIRTVLPTQVTMNADLTLHLARAVVARRRSASRG
jgi:SAM-dependent methyltransferase